MGQCTIRCPTDTAPGPFCRLADPTAYSVVRQAHSRPGIPGWDIWAGGPEGAQRTLTAGLFLAWAPVPRGGPGGAPRCRALGQEQTTGGSKITLKRTRAVCEPGMAASAKQQKSLRRKSARNGRSVGSDEQQAADPAQADFCRQIEVRVDLGGAGTAELELFSDAGRRRRIQRRGRRRG